MAMNTDIKITGIKLQNLTVKINEYGTIHFFAVQELIELKYMKMPIWE